MLLASLPITVVDRLLLLGDDATDSPPKAAARRFLDMSEDEADALLRSAGAAKLTPAGWEVGGPGQRLDAMTLLIATEPQAVRDRLSLLVDESGEAGVAATVGPSPAPSSTDSAPAADTVSETKPTAPPVADGTKGAIFVVHGHAHAVLHEAVRVLEHVTQREVVVLHERANEGRTILEKFEHHAGGAAYSVVLLTADDEGGVHSAVGVRPRGRQNVIFELGFFFGKLGRNRVAVLLDPDVEKPSDIDGLVYLSLDPAGAWKHALTRELASAGIEVDYSRIP